MITEAYDDVFVIDHDDECECGYDDDGSVTYFCKKAICPNEWIRTFI